MVRNELNFLDDGDVVYKLVGPILVKQEHEDAKMNVDKRVEFIAKEMYILVLIDSQKMDKSLKDNESSLESKRKKVINCLKILGPKYTK
jgi:prefoldin beta subunit